MRLPLLAAALLSSALPAQMTALVNDPNSHGVVGDGLLSLDEAIRVMNLQLAYGALSAGEQAQFRGLPTTVLDRIEIDYNITPVITVEPGKQITHVEGDQITHVDTDFYGLNGRPIILGGDTPIIWEVNTNHFHLHDMIMVGGQIGSTFDSSLHYHPGVRARYVNCLFLNQSQMGLQINIPASPPGEILPIDLDGTVWRNIPVGIEINDKGFGGFLNHNATGVTIENCQVGLRIDIAGFGSQCTLNWDRSEITGAECAVEVLRPTSSSVFDMQFLHCDFSATRTAFEIQGSPIGAATLGLHHCDLRGGPGASDYAFRSHPRTGRLDLTVGETSFDGEVLIQIGNVGQALKIHNSRFDNGAFTVDATGPTPDFLWNQHEFSPVTVAAGTTKPLSFQSCEFLFSPIDDQTAGMTTLTSCVMDNSAVSANVANNAPAPTRWMAEASVVPNDPPIGGHVDLTVHLQPNTAAFWLLGAGAPGFLELPPYRFYMSLVGSAGLSVASLRLPIPNLPAIQGVELYGQPVVFPTAGQGYVPLSLPRGGRFEIR